MNSKITWPDRSTEGPPEDRKRDAPASSSAHRAAFHLLERAIARLARRRVLSLIVVGGFAFALHLALALIAGIPHPRIHDEYSYLLAADTFARGRVANPAHPLWRHFESMHILQRPTYASKYPTGQGLILAAGKVVGGHFIVGAWLAGALACGASCWMLQGWLRPRLALLGAFLIGLNPFVVEWGQSYWAALPLLGGSLLLGGMRRIVDRPDRYTGLIMGLGVAILAITRPYEGLALSMVALAAVVFWRAGRGGFETLVPYAALLPAMLLPVAIALGWTAFSNAEITGRVDRLPYVVYESQYSTAPMFLFQKRTHGAVEYHNPPEWRSLTRK